MITFFVPWFLIGVLVVSNVISFATISSAVPREYPLYVQSDKKTAQAELVYGSDARLTDKDFFRTVLREMVEQKADFIYADLSTMKLRVYLAGEQSVEVPIATKGRNGSWWETPAGLYRIETKEDVHFSKMGHVSLPYAMQFSGNFFIHGWPVYPDGEPVASIYSGGCIRLRDEDAAVVYNHTTRGMPVLVYEHGFEAETATFMRTHESIAADAYVSVDLESGFVFTAHEEDVVLPIASITKLLTALVVVEHVNLESTIVVPTGAIVYTSKPRLRAGQKVRAYDLLVLLLQESSNEAAEALAASLGRERFIELMNAKAKSMGLTQTTLTDPSGADSGNSATAADLFTLVRYLHVNRTFILELTAGKVSNSFYGSPAFTNIQVLNEYKDDPQFMGGKNGQTTAAQETGVSLFAVPFEGGLRTIVTVVLGTDNRKRDQDVLRKIVTGYEKVVAEPDVRHE
jgi:hypothetical protein